jgi:hypothetical protein
MDVVEKRDAAILAGWFSNRGGTGDYRFAVFIDFFPRARRPRGSLPRRALYGFFDTGSDHDVGFAKCLREQFIKFDSVQSDG